MRRAVWLLLASSFVGASCGETNIAAIERLRPRGAAEREKLAIVRAGLPDERSDRTASAPPWPLTPELVIDYQSKRHTADVLMQEQLDDPYVDLSSRVDLLLSSDLLRCLMWTGPKNPLAPSARNDRGNLGPECEAAFARPWLVVVRTLVWELPERVELDVFVVDRRRSAQVARFPISLAGKYRREDLGRGRFRGFALSELRSEAWTAARCEVARRLARLPGAHIELSERWLGEVRDPCSAWKAGSTPFRAVATPTQVASSP